MFPDFLAEPVDVVARKLLGCHLVRGIDGRQLIVRIVETEAYDEDDAASHAYRGKTASNAAMFGPPGHLYVYFTYGMHFCCNVVTGEEGHGSGVLIRAVEPLVGAGWIEERRGMTGFNVTNGPGKVCQALGIDRELGGHDLRVAPLTLHACELLPGETISETARIGVSREKDRVRRFFITGNRYVSGPKRARVGASAPVASGQEATS